LASPFFLEQAFVPSRGWTFFGLGCGVGVVLLRFDLLFGVALGDGLGEAFFRSAKSLATELVSVSSCGVCESVWAMARKLF